MGENGSGWEWKWDPRPWMQHACEAISVNEQQDSWSKQHIYQQNKCQNRSWNTFWYSTLCRLSTRWGFFYSDIHSTLNSPLPLRVSHCGCTYASCQARWCECERKDIQLCARILGYSLCPTSVNIHFALWSRSTDLFFDEHSVGNLRFRLPEPISAYNGSVDATSYGPACPQQKLTLPILEGLPAQIVDDIVNTVFTALFPDDEDCKIHLSFWTVYARWV